MAYTTVMTMMNILESKGHLVKRPEGRAYVYEPSQAQTQVISGMVQDFVDRVFDGAAQPLVLSLLRETEAVPGGPGGDLPADRRGDPEEP